MLRDAGGQGFCVSTLREAEAFFAQGFDDFFYCVPFDPHKAGRAADLAGKGCTLTLMVDGLDGAHALVAAAEAVSVSTPLPIVVEIDVDGYRSGAPINGDEVLDAARVLDASTATRFAGLLSYGGASYHATPDEAADLAERHRRTLIEMRDRLKAAGRTCETLSFGSTPAVLHARHLDGLTELRCGIHTFQDLFQAGIGACAVEDIALSVLATVIGRQPDHDRIVIDAGGLALSKDRSTAGRDFDAGYGLVCDAATGAPIDDLAVLTVSQELGLVASRSGASLDMERFPIGRRVRVLPNHADMTAAAYDRYAVVEGDAHVRDVWMRINHWDRFENEAAP